MDLFDLEPNEVALLYWKCRDKSEGVITSKLGDIAPSTLYSIQSKALAKLELPGKDNREKLRAFKRKGFCRILLQITEEDIKDWYVRKEELRQKFSPSIEKQEINGEKSRVNILLVGVLLLITAILAATGGYYFGQINSPSPQVIIITATPPSAEIPTSLPRVLESPQSSTSVASPLPSLTPSPENTKTAISTKTLLPTITPTEPSVEVTTISNGPTGDWAVRIYQTDDANMILVNNHIVGGTFYRGVLDWVEINNLLQTSEPNYVTTVNLNAPGHASSWGFSLRHNDAIVWGNEGNADRCALCYTQTVLISPDDTLSEVNLRNFDNEKLSGSWSTKIVAADFGVIMVNGVVVAGSYKGADLGWFDVTGLLYEGQDNTITLAIWNNDGDYSWDAALRKGETIVWGSNNQGSGQSGEVFFTTVTIDGAGNIVP